MPIQYAPMRLEIKRKATDGTFTSEIEDEEERKKYLGSYYSCQQRSHI